MLGANTHMVNKSKILDGDSSVLSKFSMDELFESSSESLEYFWTKETRYLNQYTKIIDDIYKEEVNINNAYTAIEADDLRSHFYIATIKDEVIAGARYTINDPFQRYSLPAEAPGFSFASLFPELDLENNRFAQITKLGVVSEHRNNIIHYKNGFKEFKNISTRLGAKYIFVVATLDRIRLYNLVGKKFFKVLDPRKADIEAWDTHSHLDMYIAVYENDI